MKIGEAAETLLSGKTICRKLWREKLFLPTARVYLEQAPEDDHMQLFIVSCDGAKPKKWDCGTYDLLADDWEIYKDGCSAPCRGEPRQPC